MHERIRKMKESNRQTFANSAIQKKTNLKQDFVFWDNRPKTIVQRKSVDMLNNAQKPLITTTEKINISFPNNLPLQYYATLDDVKKMGEKILGHKVKMEDESLEENKVPVQKKVIQRVVAHNLGNPYTFQVVPADLGRGTATTPMTRAFVNGPAAPHAPTATFSYGYFPGGGGWMPGAAPGPLLIAPNPPPVWGNYDAGHALGRQNGGLGHVNNWVFPQDRNVNRGWAGTFPLWRAHENAFNAGVAALPPGGFGIWHVTLP